MSVSAVRFHGGRANNQATKAHKKISAASTNATVVEARPANLNSVYAYNASAAVKFVKFYDKATAPTVGTDVPVYVLGLPANSWGAIEPPPGLPFSLGLSYAITGASPDADTTAVAVGDVILNMIYTV